MTIQEIYNQIGQKELMEYYYGESIIDKRPIYRNKLRNDRKGTCSFFWSKSNKYLFHDFAENVFYDVAGYVQEYYNLKTFKEVVNKIMIDFNLGKIDSKPGRNRTYKTQSNTVSNYVKKKNFEVNIRPFKQIDLLF